MERLPSTGDYNLSPVTPSTPPRSLLDIGHQNCTRYWCIPCKRGKRRKGRAFHRIMSGLTVGGNLKLLTLTTSEESWQMGKDIQASFRALIMRLRRRNLCQGYVRVVEFTKRGRPHYHVVIRAPFLPQWLLSKWWGQIHLSPIVDVRRVSGARQVASYLAKYLGKDPNSRYSWSWDWVWKGFAGTWRQMVSLYLRHEIPFPDILAHWNGILTRYGHRRFAPAAVG